MMTWSLASTTCECVKAPDWSFLNSTRTSRCGKTNSFADRCVGPSKSTRSSSLSMGPYAGKPSLRTVPYTAYPSISPFTRALNEPLDKNLRPSSRPGIKIPPEEKPLKNHTKSEIICYNSSLRLRYYIREPLGCPQEPDAGPGRVKNNT